MKFQKVILLLMTSLVLLAACNQGDEQDEAIEKATEEEAGIENEADQEVIALAENFIAQLSEGQYEEAADKFDETMTEQLSPEELEELWESLKSQLGELIDYEYNRIEPVEGYEVVLINGVFNNADATFQVTVDEDQQIAGFYIQ